MATGKLKRATQATPAPRKTLKEQIRERIDSHILPRTYQIGPGNNITPDLADIFVAQEMMMVAAEISKDAWKSLANRELVDSDDAIRELGAGEHTICNGRALIAVANVKKEAKSFDLDVFVPALCKRFNLSPKVADEIKKIYEASKVEGVRKAALSKRVVETGL